MILTTPSVIAVTPVTLPVGWHYPPHRHDDYCQMLLIGRGSVRVRINGCTHVAEPGQTLLYVAGQTHEEWNTSTRTAEATYFGFTWDTRRRGPKGIPVLGSDHSGRIIMLARWMMNLGPRLCDEERGVLGTLMHAILIEHVLPSEQPESDLICRVREYVRDRLRTRLRLDELATAAGVSRFHFAHTFRSMAGVSPMRFARRVRLEAAHGLIVSTALPLKQIARQTGFADAYALSKAFHREYGRRPSAVRRSSP
jgi:AraC-like DNA-binding protein